MDVLALDFLRSTSAPGSPGRSTSGDARRRRLSLSVAVATIQARVTSGSGPGGVGGAAAIRRNGLLAYTGASIILGLGLLAWTSFVSAPLPAIDPGFPPGTVLSGPTGGLLLWLVFGLLGSLRVLRAQGGSTMTFHLPFVGAAMILGGPTAGAWVAFLSSIERRELESQPWYGILANHSVLTIAAVMGGLTTQVVAGLTGAEGHGTATLVAVTAGTLVLVAVTTGMGVVTVLLREDISARAFLDILVGQFGRITALEAALVLVLATAYTELGWWSPLLIGGFVLLVWDDHPMPAPDALTGLQSARDPAAPRHWPGPDAARRDTGGGPAQPRPRPIQAGQRYLRTRRGRRGPARGRGAACGPGATAARHRGAPRRRRAGTVPAGAG